ncbi:MAG: ArsA family ATPase [Deltaproteobacteria bacterium]|nr:MAG: ArsA family ATPase [Deltaproteobacteria bacterium]TMQ27346.1 MAG: ArsA family ATPase [Deltaproteobacteria bacterium]
MKLDRKLILVVGKGGVGRSTVAAAIAGNLAAQGKKTLLYETSANDRFGPYFDKPAVGEAITALAPNLWAVNSTPASALAEYGLMILRWKSVYEMVFENRVSKAFLRAIPGLDDYALLGKAWYHTTEEKRGAPAWDTVVFDMPASGHSVSMLRVPWVIVDTVPEGPLTRDARTVKAMLCDPARTAAVLVTLAEEMPVNEAIELEAKLTALGIVPQQLLVNQVFPQHFPPGAPVSRALDALVASITDAGALSPPLAQLAAHAQLSRDRRALNERYLAELRARAKTRVAELPMLFAQTLGKAEVALLGDRITSA